MSIGNRAFMLFSLLLWPSFAYSTLLEEGISDSNQGMYDQAIGKLTEYLRKNPSAPEAHYNLAVVYYKKGLYDEAWNEFQHSIQDRTTDPMTYYFLGLIGESKLLSVTNPDEERALRGKVVGFWESFLKLGPRDDETNREIARKHIRNLRGKQP